MGVDRSGVVKGRLTKTPTSARLTPGLGIWKGTVDEEYLADLKPWNKAYKVYRQMKDDAVIGTLFESVTVPLLDAKFSIKPAGPNTIKPFDLEDQEFAVHESKEPNEKEPSKGISDADKRAMEWLHNNLFHNPDINWLGHVDEMLEFMAYGFSLSEKVLEKHKDGTMRLKDLIPIGQETLYRWGDIDKYGNVTAFIQYDPVQSYPFPGIAGAQTVNNQTIDKPFRAAPMAKLLHFRLSAEKA